MKVIETNLLSGVSATSENPNFPAINLLDNHPKRKYKANASNDTLISGVVGGSNNTIAIFNTNAQSATVSIYDPNIIEWPDTEWNALEWVSSNIKVDVDMIVKGSSRTIYGEYPTITSPCIFLIELKANPGETVEAGVIVVGKAVVYNEPRYGIQQTNKDYSIFKEYYNGSYYTKKKDVVRTFTLNVLFDRETEYYSFMDLARDNSYNPLVWKLTDVNNGEWIIYGRFGAQPTSSHDTLKKSNVSFSVIEVL